MKKNIALEVFKIESHSIGYVSNSFLTEFGSDDVFPGAALSFQKLARNMNDSEILSELKIQECTLGDIIATLDAATSDMKDGNWNIFYVKGHSRVVDVRWSADGGEWDVRDWRRDGGSWDGGVRVFSPATESCSSSPEFSGSLTLETLVARIQELEKWKERVQK